MNPKRLSPIALIVATLTACAGTGAGDGALPLWMGPVAAGEGPILHPKVASWKTRKFDGLVRQRTDFSCGAAVLATIFNGAFNKATTEQQVLVNMLRIADPDVVREKGFSLLDMKNYVRNVGLEAEGYKVDYDALVALNVPAIALIDIRGYKHFVVIRRANEAKVALGDPALGNRFMSRAAFNDAWNGVAFVITGEGYDPANALRDAPDPLSARKLFEQFATLPTAEAAEAGINRGFNPTF